MNNEIRRRQGGGGLGLMRMPYPPNARPTPVPGHFDPPSGRETTVRSMADLWRSVEPARLAGCLGASNCSENDADPLSYGAYLRACLQPAPSTMIPVQRALPPQPRPLSPPTRAPTRAPISLEDRVPPSAVRLLSPERSPSPERLPTPERPTTPERSPTPELSPTPQRSPEAQPVSHKGARKRLRECLDGAAALTQQIGSVFETVELQAAEITSLKRRLKLSNARCRWERTENVALLQRNSLLTGQLAAARQAVSQPPAVEDATVPAPVATRAELEASLARLRQAAGRLAD